MLLAEIGADIQINGVHTLRCLIFHDIAHKAERGGLVRAVIKYLIVLMTSGFPFKKRIKHFNLETYAGLRGADKLPDLLAEPQGQGLVAHEFQKHGVRHRAYS